MCTCISYSSGDHYFGRNLDLEYSYHEAVAVTPRNFPFSFRCAPELRTHYAIIGIATVEDGYPLYYDATNECGLSMAGLNFPGNAVYCPKEDHADNIAPFEFIPWVLGQCENVEQARKLIEKVNLVDLSFSEEYPLSPLHWMVADSKESIVIESETKGIKIYDDPVGVLTNNPPFAFHMYNLCHYMNLTREEPINRLTDKVSLVPFSRGMGAIGLPGDLSSSSRFIRAAFTKLNSVDDGTEAGAVSQFFHILGAVTQQRGCVRINDAYEKTVYTSCCNTSKGIYYYTSYENSQIRAVDMYHTDLECKEVVSFPLALQQQVQWEN